MPERIFKYKTTEALLAAVSELGDLLTSGSGPTNAIKNSHTGFLKETGAVTQEQIKNYFMAARYEIYLRGKGVDGNPSDPACVNLETCDPYHEKKMRVVAQFQKWPGSNGGWQNQF